MGHLQGSSGVSFPVACEGPSQDVRVELLTSEYNGKELSFYVGIPGLSVCEALAGKGNSLAFL